MEESKDVIILCAYEDGEEDKCDELHLTADSSEGFTAGELLYKIHNQTVAYLEKLDYHFFEGLVDNGVHEQHSDIP